MLERVDRCEVCQCWTAKEVRKSTLGNFHFAYCGECLKWKAEPRLFVYAMIEQYGHWQQVPRGVSLVYYAGGKYYDARKSHP